MVATTVFFNREAPLKEHWSGQYPLDSDEPEWEDTSRGPRRGPEGRKDQTAFAMLNDQQC
jgi:hypothetical protein